MRLEQESFEGRTYETPPLVWRIIVGASYLKSHPRLNRIAHKSEHWTHCLYLGGVSMFAHEAYRYCAMLALLAVIIGAITDKGPGCSPTCFGFGMM